jgi:hypothetical protein
MSNVAINIAAEFTGKKAFKQAETSTDKLNKSVKKLAGGLLLAFGTKQIVAFGKASVKAFAEDDKAARALGQTLKNLGLAYGSNASTVNGFISRLELQTGVLDDELRPAMDRLLRATGDVTKSQELLGLALDISAGTGKSLTQVSQSLQKAYLGQTQALGRLGVGLSRAELTSSSFEEIQARLSTLFAGQATAAADTYAGSLAKLTVAGNNAKETIGKGLVDAFVTASNSSSIDDLIGKIDRAAEAMAGFLRETGKFIQITKDIFKNPSFFAPSGGLFGDGKGFGNISMTVSSQDTQRADAIAKKNATAMAKLTGVQAANQAKILKDKRLATAIDKANLALNKGNEVFDMDKIQIAAALTNQAEQLGKATSSAQVLQIANDTARLNVKKSILALEDAIASKDEAAIIAATNKLNEDLKILGALSNQKTQMIAIESILKGLMPKELIDQKNLDDALSKIREMLRLLASMSSASSNGTGRDLSTPSGVAAITRNLPSSVSAADFFNSLTEDEQGMLGGYTPFVGANIPSTIPYNSGGSGAGLGSNGSGRQVPAGVNITVNTGVGDPNAIAEAIDQVLREAQQRGTLVGGVFAI